MSEIYEIPLESTEASFKIRTDLEDTTYVLRFDWNTREERWHLSVYDADEVPLVVGAPLNIDTDVLRLFRNPDLPPGILMLYDTGETHEEAGRDDLGNRALLLYQEAA